MILTDKKTGKSIEIKSAKTWTYGSENQKSLATSKEAEYILVHNSRVLPLWIQRALDDIGYTAVQIGYTTYVSTTYAIIKKEGVYL